MTTPTRLLSKDKHVIEELTQAGFFASEEQIEALARYNLQNITGSDAVKGIYLKSLIVGVQKHLEDSQVEQEPTVVLNIVHERYYKAVMRAVTPQALADDAKLPKDVRRARSQERNRRGNFARSAKSTVLSFIKADGDIMQLNAETITKTELSAFSLAMRSHVVPQATLTERAAAAIDRLEELIRQLADGEKGTAVLVSNQALKRMAALLVEMGAGVPERIDGAMVVPMGRLAEMRAAN